MKLTKEELILGIRIGNNVKIGTNCVVVEDIPDNATVVLSKPRIIIKQKNSQKNLINSNLSNS